MYAQHKQCPILVESKGQMIKSSLFASDAEEPADISMKIRDQGWKPFRVRFDDTHSAWVVSTLEYTQRQNGARDSTRRPTTAQK